MKKASPSLSKPKFSLCVLITLAAFFSVGLQPPANYLQPKTTLVCEVKGGDVKSYTLILDAGKTVEVYVEQRASDVELRLKDPNGEKLISTDSVTGPVGWERLVWVPDAPGYYQLEIEAWDYVKTPGCFEVRYEQSRPAGAVDRRRVEATMALSAAHRSGKADDFRRAATLFAEIDDNWGQTEALNSLGYLLQIRGQEGAREIFEQALGMAVDDVQKAYASENFGAFLQAEEPFQARQLLRAAAAIWAGKTGARYWQMQSAGHLGNLASSLGEYHEAYQENKKALEIARELQEPRDEELYLFNFAKFLRYIGQQEEAYAAYQESLRLIEENDLKHRWLTLAKMSTIEADEGNYRKAVKTAREAVALAAELDERDRAISHHALGYTLHQSGIHEEARQHYQQAFTLFTEAKRDLAATKTRLLLAQLSLDEGNCPHAKNLFEEVLKDFQRAGSRSGEADALLGIARCLHALGRLEEARFQIARAIDIVQEMRDWPDSPELRSSFIASRRHFFDFQNLLLMDLHSQKPTAGYDRQALVEVERSKSRSLLEMLRLRGVDIRPEEEVRTLERLRKALVRQTNEKTEAKNPLNEEIGPTREVDQLKKELFRIRRQHPHYAGLSGVKTLNVEEIQGLLDDETAFLEYFLGEEASFLWLVQKDSVQSFQLPPRPRIEDMVEDALGHVKQGRWPQVRDRKLRDLREVVIDPVLEDPAFNAEKVKRLLVSGDGALLALPFNILPLPDSNETLLSKFEFVYQHSASTLAAVREVAEKQKESGLRQGQASVLALGDALYNLEGRTGNTRARRLAANGTIVNLPHTREEVLAIQEIFQDNLEPRLGADANKEILHKDIKRYRYLHFALHGVLTDNRFEQSELLFARFDENDNEVPSWRLGLTELYGLELAADLVVLSACSSALGEETDGEGMVGVAHGFMYAGASGVVASLWEVPDESTRHLMEYFYSHLSDGKSPGAALRAAQRDFIANHSEGLNPLNWAGFILQGDFS